MRDSAGFDELYLDARHRLLHQAYALTGDLPAAQGAVRDAFVHAWHHWDRVSGLADPEGWVRPQAWARARRRHRPRTWRRGGGELPGVAETLHALDSLSATQRRLLLLEHLVTGPLPRIAREAELPLATAERELRAANRTYADRLGVDVDRIGESLDGLGRAVPESGWPRPTTIRRVGGARRRTYAVAGVAAAVGLLVASGAAVTAEDGARPRLTTERVVASLEPLPVVPTPAPVELSATRLLTARQVSRVDPRRRWKVESTSENAGDAGPALPCDVTPVTGPRAVGGLVRTYSSRPAAGAGSASDPTSGSASVVQSSVLSLTPRAARRTYEGMTGWFAGCPQDRVQLLATQRVEGVGDDATLIVLRSWGAPVTTMVVGTARTGRVTTTTVSSLEDSGDPVLADHAALLAAAVNALCGQPGTGSCAAPPSLEVAAPMPTGDAPGMLGVVDLPPVTNVASAWVGTQPRKATVNAAATQCDGAVFTQPPMTNALTRTFLVPEASLPDTFGLTETVGTLPEPAATEFVAGVRRSVATCEDDNPGTTVTEVADVSQDDLDLTVWRLQVELSDEETATYLMGILRSGTAVAQVGFTPTPEVQMAPGAFLALVDRAAQRLAFMPSPASSSGRSADGRGER